MTILDPLYKPLSQNDSGGTLGEGTFKLVFQVKFFSQSNFSSQSQTWTRTIMPVGFAFIRDIVWSSHDPLLAAISLLDADEGMSFYLA